MSPQCAILAVSSDPKALSGSRVSRVTSPAGAGADEVGFLQRTSSRELRSRLHILRQVT